MLILTIRYCVLGIEISRPPPIKLVAIVMIVRFALTGWNTCIWSNGFNLRRNHHGPQKREPHCRSQELVSFAFLHLLSPSCLYPISIFCLGNIFHELCNSLYINTEIYSLRITIFPCFFICVEVGGVAGERACICAHLLPHS